MAGRTTVRRSLRWICRVALCVLLAVGLPSAGGMTLTAPPAAAVIVYPDLQMQVPISEITISRPAPTSRELRFTHITWNSGAGPLEIQPNYDLSTATDRSRQAG